MNAEIPYALYLKFLKPTDARSLIMSLDSFLVCLGEERIDEEFSIVHYHFENDTAKKAVLHVEIETISSERINISLYDGVEIETIKALFSFLQNFDTDKTVLIDQEIKNDYYIKHSEALSEEQADKIETQARLTLSFDAFYENTTGLLKRNNLFGKS